MPTLTIDGGDATAPDVDAFDTVVVSDSVLSSTVGSCLESELNSADQTTGGGDGGPGGDGGQTDPIDPDPDVENGSTSNGGPGGNGGPGSCGNVDGGGNTSGSQDFGRHQSGRRR